MSLKHEHRQGGTGGGQQKNLYVDSPDRSVNVHQQSTERVDEVLLSVPMATESQNGRESALDKYVHDHSLANVAQLEKASDENGAILQLLREDVQYAPREGQFLGWTDLNDQIHLSRYHALTVSSLPRRAWWISSCYDDVHDTWCILAGSDQQNDHGISANYTVAVTHDNGLTWSGFQTPASEIWKWVEAGNGYIVGISGNRSSEIYFSSDGGENWTKKIINDRRWYKCRFDKYNNRFFIFGESGICVTSDFQTFSYDFAVPAEVSGKPINDIAFLSENNIAYLYNDGGSAKLSVAFGYNGTQRTVITFENFVDQMNVDVTGVRGICLYKGESDSTNKYIYYVDAEYGSDKLAHQLDFSVNRGNSYGTGEYISQYPILHAFPCGSIQLVADEYDYQQVIVFCTAYEICRGFVNLHNRIL